MRELFEWSTWNFVKHGVQPLFGYFSKIAAKVSISGFFPSWNISPYGILITLVSPYGTTVTLASIPYL